MNSNYQVNKFYSQEKMNSHLQAAEAHRLARKANSGTGVRKVVNAAAGRVYGRAGSAMSQMVQLLQRVGEARVSTR